MRLASAGAPHLGYCTNIHSGESWAEVQANLETHVLAVKRRVAPDRPFGVGLRLSGRAAAELSEGEGVAELRAWLDAHGLYVFTINGFPYGTFHRARVKEEVYLPDWLDDERLAYTDRLAEILAALLPDDVAVGSVSTVPGAFKPRIRGREDVAAVALRMIRHAAALVRLRDRTGKHVALAIEPEPFCQLETIGEATSFFEEHLFSRAAVAASGLKEEDLRAHLGLCLDACHMAVAFEDPASTFRAAAAHGIRVAKIQVSAGLEVRAGSRPPAELLAELDRFAEGVYLHQVTESRGSGELRRWLDLPEAIAAARAGGLAGTWRVHFHVPLFREELGAFHSTQRWLAGLLGCLRDDPVSPQLEVETYTWDVLPEEHRAIPVDEAIARELSWVVDTLGAAR